ncbi:TnsD family Tn7-like transposition protein [Acinetobacter baumannii]|uniref:TnsD family Tn7-like transposition protein n=1 Tax=Acinetobacter baumannii TaxID=470 RepID=UPI00234DC40F|nr:TnsD family Tn7-like transposition protein [Acinetobacter baumannii]MDC7429288.1 TnsD family Tn7-like transposition protein [Acinetobacter baumannii]MDC7466693.1 TnsD family Tn7-like transposition protein [Acinetobacter baumannii]
MQNFPPPNTNELLYSTIARAGIYHGITSPKQLLDAIFGNRSVIATLDLPSCISDIAHQLKNTRQYLTDDLIRQHTLFPLYAPFVPRKIRDKAIKLMQGKTNGALHTMLGISASKVKAIQNFQVCPKCIDIQKQKYGEAFWKRDWFIPNLPVCIEHGPLTIYKEKPSDSRHHFQPLIESNFSVESFSSIFPQDILMSYQVQQLFKLTSYPSISFEQWSYFYHGIATDFGYTRGKHIRHGLILECVLQHWGTEYLQTKNLLCHQDEENSWLKTIFRKHRKSFSFFEHLLIWQTLIPKEKLEDIFHHAQHIQPIFIVRTKHIEDDLDLAKRTKYQKRWQQLVEQHGIQSSRSQENGGAIYAWLYRHNYQWLQKFNSQHQVIRPAPETRFEWYKRDREYVKALLRISYQCKENLGTPRHSANWYLMQLPQHSTIEHNLAKLPLVRRFLIKYVESITEYQLRRVCVAVESLSSDYQPLHLWRVFRLAGLSKERITPDAAKILKLSGFFKTDDSKN